MERLSYIASTWIPQTKLMWRKIIPLLSKHYTVITADLRGYGDSDKPASKANHSTYSKREMAKDQMLHEKIRLQ